MHILLATTGYPPEHSGAGSRLHATYQRLAAVDTTFSWSVLMKTREAMYRPPSGPRRIVAFNRGMEEFPSLLEACAEAFWATRQLAGDLLDDVDLVHSAGWTWTVPPLIWAARRRRIPIIRELTTPGEPGGEGVGGRLVRWCNRQASQIVAISPALEKAARRGIAVDIPIWCRPNGVDTARFRPADQNTRARRRAELRTLLAQVIDDDIVVLHVGRIRSLKNQLLLAESIGRLPHRFKLVLAGPAYQPDDGYADAVRRRLAASDLAGRATLIEGNVSHVEQLMQAADIFAFPSTHEGLGTVMIEALCCGLPVVASRLPGITDWVVHEGENGYLSALDPASFANRLQDATALLPFRQRIAVDAGKAFDQALIDDGYRALFQRVVARS